MCSSDLDCWDTDPEEGSVVNLNSDSPINTDEETPDAGETGRTGFRSLSPITEMDESSTSTGENASAIESVDLGNSSDDAPQPGHEV